MKPIELLGILADGRFHSGAQLGQRLGVSRAAVWKHIKALAELGIDCHSVPGKGYRLTAPLELLQHESILTAMSDAQRSLLSALEIHSEITSTNRYLMERAAMLRSGHACFAERQSAGRGRRGREWVSPFARNIYLSVYWQFALSPADLSALGLAMGVAVMRVLRQLGVKDVGLKWPNDVLCRGHKLAGILIEMSGESAGPYHVVVGVGLNVDMPQTHHAAIDQPWIDLATILRHPVSRNRVAGKLLTEILAALDVYQRRGFAAFRNEWQQCDAFAGAPVMIMTAMEQIAGRARGVDEAGALLLETESGMQRFHSGEVSLRRFAE
ncbi:MAG: bifunctional biotin--[acetyl-CoA-carboxylase] ligase/biotin operon repressor BirA [Gammaproteobacteria bacterium]|nr:bifunctional biotin--[acetyl-CoA-carboxylase] ligase/biotin operon repressor BirA [Gammaproteobacteria bacterium]